MRRLILLAILALSAAHAAYAEEWVVDAEWQTPADLARIAPYFEHLKIDRKQHTARVLAGDAELAVLDQLGIDYRIDMAATASLRTFYSEAFNRNRSIPGYACYRTVEETYASMDQLAAAHPTLAQVIDIGPTWVRTQNASAGYQMRVLRIGNSATDATIPNKPNMVVFSSIHAREYAPAEVNTHFAEWLLDNYGRDAEATWLVDHENFHLILQANPDGRKKAETGLSWRKNTNTAVASCSTNANNSGVDLNRNFPFHWGIVPNQGGSSTNICSQTFRGPLAMSEPETNALVTYVAGTCTNDGVCTGGVLPDLRNGPLHPANVSGDGGDAAPSNYPGMFLDMHSFAELVLWSWGDQSSPAPNGSALRTFGRRLAWYNGYSPEQSDTLYPTDGATDDNFYGSLGVPAYTFELDLEFFEPCTPLLAKTIPDNLAALRYAARNLHAPYLLPGGPDVTRIEATPDLVAAGTAVLLSARIDDSQFNQGQGVSESIQNISMAQAYLDGLPWEGSLPVASMAASDGAFNSPAEEVNASIVTAGLTIGKHLLFVQGTDASAQAGTPNAVFIEIAQPSDIATLAGTITAQDTGSPLATTLRVTNDSTGETRTTRSSAVDGHYSSNLFAGTVSIHVDAPPGYLDEDIASVSLTGGTTQTRNISLLNCAVFTDDVESGPNGWAAQSPWVQNTTTGNTTTVWATPNYGNSLNSSLSRVIDLSGSSGNSLTFDDRCDTESGYDFGRVEISVNGGSNWTSLYQCSGRARWQANRIALPASTDNLADFRLRFRLTSDSSVTAGGWAIDNIAIESDPALCRAAQNDLIFKNGFE